MAVYLAVKFPGDALSYGWAVPVSDGDSVASYTVTPAYGSAVLEGDMLDCDVVTLFVSGGTTGEVSTFEVTATTTQGETFSETLYLPVAMQEIALGNTARDVCMYALRKITGVGVAPDADEMTDAMERLNAMLAAWIGQGADIGVPLPLEESSVLYVRDEFIQPVKANLLVRCAGLYEFQPSAYDVEDARRGLQLVKAALLPDDRGQADYY